jgi:hypothetical protein
MKKLLSYISRSGVDVILILASIAIAIRMYDTNMMASGLLLFYSIYVFGFILRMGISTDIINDYVVDKKVRKEMNLHPIPGEVYINKQTVFATIITVLFWVVLVGMLTFYATKII